MAASRCDAAATAREGSAVQLRRYARRYAVQLRRYARPACGAASARAWVAVSGSDGRYWGGSSKATVGGSSIERDASETREGDCGEEDDGEADNGEGETPDARQGDAAPPGHWRRRIGTPTDRHGQLRARVHYGIAIRAGSHSAPVRRVRSRLHEKMRSPAGSIATAITASPWRAWRAMVRPAAISQT